MTLAGIAGVLGIGQQVLGLGQGISGLFGGGQKKYGPTEQETAMALDMQSKLAGGGGGGAAMAAPIFGMMTRMMIVVRDAPIVRAASYRVRALMAWRPASSAR